MRLYLDENLSPAVAQALRVLGHDAVHAIEVGEGGADDVAWIPRAVAAGRVVVTCDRRLRRRRSEIAALRSQRAVALFFHGQPTASEAVVVLLDRSRVVEDLAADVGRRTALWEFGRKRKVPLRVG